ncbi:MAG TPA: ferrous iron transport protein A [Clostridiaceae bacterium]|nr:ferrous iron transport protein A [Clostridiaceae bacterium]
MPLTLLRPGERALIRNINGKADTRSRLRSMGLVEGATTELISYDNCIVLIKVGDCRLALDKELAARVLVTPTMERGCGRRRERNDIGRGRCRRHRNHKKGWW